MNECQHTTMCIVHKGFRGFRAVSPALIWGGNLTGLKPAIPYDTIHSTLCVMRRNVICSSLESYSITSLSLSYFYTCKKGDSIFFSF